MKKLYGIMAAILCGLATAQDNPDMAVTNPEAAELKPMSLFLTPIESIDIPEPKAVGKHSRIIKRVHLYDSPDDGEFLYLMAEEQGMGEGKETTLYLVGVFWGYRMLSAYTDGEYEYEESLSLEDLDGDGWPELILRHLCGADAAYLRVFRIAQQPQKWGNGNACDSFTGMVKMIGVYVVGIGSAVVENGQVVVRRYDEGANKPKSTVRYGLKQGEDKLTEIK